MRAIGRHVSKLLGYAPALPTPFNDQGNIDDAAFARLCELQIANGATALVVCETTGEAPTLSPKEHRDLVRNAVSLSSGRVPVIAGAGANATAHAVELTRDAEAAGADAILSVVPYYNKPTQAGLYAHFREIAGFTGLPVILYDAPSRTACSLADETVARLAEVPNVMGLNDASGDATRPARLRPLVGRDFRLLCGDDALALAYFAQGGDGCISVTSNIAPALCHAMFMAWKHNQTARARRLVAPIAQLTAALSQESNPVLVKHALFLFSLMSPRARLPLVESSTQSRVELSRVLAQMCDKYSEYMIGSVREYGDVATCAAVVGGT
jgi:4-hydroxy-tetrahydrodipicolinate synthase